MIVLYGASGYMGELIAREAVRSGLTLTLAGRHAEALSRLAAQTGQSQVSFTLDDPGAAAQVLQAVGATLLINASGPFHLTTPTLVRAAIMAGVHYLDLAGEVEDFQTVQALENHALAAGVMLMPGVGFGVFPTDSLATYLARQLPNATHLRLAFATQGGVSQGTAQTVLYGLRRGGVRMNAGRLIPAPAAWRRRDIDFGHGPQRALFNPWRADLLSAHLSTGIGTIETYSVIPGPLAGVLRLDPWWPRLTRSAGLGRLLSRAVASQARGPSAPERAAGRSDIWAEVQGAGGEVRRARLHGPEAYDFSAATALLAARLVQAGQTLPGFRTPAEIFGPDAVLAVPGVSREDL